MILKQITAKRFRTLENIKVVFDDHYCTISGKNNAGKSSLIELISILFNRTPRHSLLNRIYEIDYKEDKTQWLSGKEPIEIEYLLDLKYSDDSSLILFIEKLSKQKIGENDCQLCLKLTVDSNNRTQKSAKINETSLDTPTAKEIFAKLSSSNLLFLHNSTEQEEVFFGSRKPRSLIELVLSKEEHEKLETASKTVQSKIKQLAKEHREELNNLLGKLTDKYDVQFTTLNASYTRNVPFVINLSDKNVEVPINDWGSGTQNRTFILISILLANRIKTREVPDDKITPIVIIEEPEAFLHPSAQAEFGKILRTLSKELGIQIIATSHSPYMLNQEVPEANILLCRNIKRRKMKETIQLDTSGEKWMAPFSEHLGLAMSEFESWKPIFNSFESKVLLVEGETDKAYFEFLRTNKLGNEVLNSDIEIVPYGGKSTLTNNLLIKFVLSKFDKTFITFDKDAANEVTGTLNRLGLKEDVDYKEVGLNQGGKEAIEGLLPQRVLSVVMSKETDLILQASSTSKDAKRAREILKQKYLDEFKKRTDYTNDELKEFMKLTKLINRKMA